MARLLRLCLITALLVLAFRVAYPDSPSSGGVRLWAFLTLGALGVGGLAAAIETSTKGFLWAMEGLFLAAALGVLATRPNARGTPWRQWLDGRVPDRAAAARGVRSLGLRHDRAPGSLILGLFPK